MRFLIIQCSLVLGSAMRSCPLLPKVKLTLLRGNGEEVIPIYALSKGPLKSASTEKGGRRTY